MADCCVESSQAFQVSPNTPEQHQVEDTAMIQQQTNADSTPQTSQPQTISIPSCPPLLFSSFIEQSSQAFINLCLFQDQVVIAQDRLAKSTLVFDGLVKFGIFSESHGEYTQSKITFCKNQLSTTFLFLNSAEAQLWYLKLLELGIPQLVQIHFPTEVQQNHFGEQQRVNELLEQERQKVHTHTKKPSIFKYESLNLSSPQTKGPTNRFNKTNGQIQSFLYKLILTKSIRNAPKQDAIVLQQVLL